jgi:hypothetical protein
MELGIAMFLCPEIEWDGRDLIDQRFDDVVRAYDS